MMHFLQCVSSGIFSCNFNFIRKINIKKKSYIIDDKEAALIKVVQKDIV